MLEMYTPADSDPVSRSIRACAWVCWGGTIIFLALLIFNGTGHRQNPYARSEWIGFAICSSASSIARFIEQRHKKKKETHADE